MSTCPDPDLFSAYFDGEVPSPWKNKLETHLSSCPECEKRTARYARIRTGLVANQPEMTADRLEASYTRLCAKIKQRPARNAELGKYAQWFRASISIPLPAAAALLLVAIMVPTLLARNSAPRQNSLQLAAANQQMLYPFGNDARALESPVPVYGPELSVLDPTDPLAGRKDRRAFTMVEYARHFAADGDLFKDAEIVIIKLPELTNFSDSGNRIVSETDSLIPVSNSYR